MITIAVSNHKGGVGKSTIATNLSIGLTLQGYKVLLIDNDPQGNATVGIGVYMEDLDPETPYIGTLYSAKAVTNIMDFVMNTPYENLSLIPSHIGFNKVDQYISGKSFREQILDKAIKTATDFDYVVVDCSSDLKIITHNALFAADKILIPITLDNWAVRGLTDQMEIITDLKGTMENPNFKPYDIKLVKSMVSGYGKDSNQKIEDALNAYSDMILNSKIKQTVGIRKSQIENEEGKLVPVILHKSSEGSKDLRNLTREIIEIWSQN
jgi:chromosome partitioning protein